MPLILLCLALIRYEKQSGDRNNLPIVLLVGITFSLRDTLTAQ